MVELIEAIILDKLAPKEPVSVSYDIGLNEIPYDKRYIFNFLMLRNQALDKGTFIVNNKTFFPNDDSNESLFVIAINSQNISMSVCFDVNQEINKDKAKEVQQDLILLRNMSLDTTTDRLNKLRAIFNVLVKHKAAYILINKNNDINKSSIDLVENVIYEFISELTIITLDSHIKGGPKIDELDETLFINKTSPKTVEESQPIKKEEPIPEMPPLFDVVEIGGDNDGIHIENKKEKKSLFMRKPKEDKSLKEDKPTLADETKKDKNGFSIDFHYIKKLFKKEWSSFLFILYGALATSFFFFIVPYQFSIKNGTLSAIFLIGGILCYVVTVLIVSSLYSFVDKETISKKRMIYTTVTTELFIVIGMLFAILIFTILKNKNILVTKEAYKASHMILGFVFIVLILILPFVVKYIRKISNRFIAIFKKDGENNEKF